MDTKALRQKILDLAIRGKLVPQDPNDEPASVLLEHIRAEKQQMVKDGKLKAKDIKNDTVIFKGDDNLHYEQFDDGTVKCIEDEIPFEIPEGWVWDRLGNIATIARGGSPRPIKSFLTTDEQGINWIKIGDTEKDGKYIFSTKEKIKPEGMVKSRYVQSGDFLLTNSMSFGRPYILRTDGCIHDGWLVIGNIKSVFNQDYLYYSLSADFMYKTLAIMAGGSTVDNLNSDMVKSLIFPIPPYNEQVAIANKVDDLLKIVEKINKNKETVNSIIKNTKSKILDLAIRGKLVPQDPNDEPASVLLERIRVEKEELIKQGKIKRDKKESVIFKGDDNSYYEKIGNNITCIDDEIPFEIPENWSWCRLDTIGNWKSGATPSRKNPDYYNGSIPWIKTGDLNDGYIVSVPESISKIALQETSVKMIPTNTVLIAMYGATIGKVGITTCEATTNQACCACCNPNIVTEKYLFYFLQSKKNYFENIAVGGAQPNISKEKIIATLIPVPPINEQNNIVAKIEKLLTSLESIC